ncbi:MAG: SDR family NAD(P)-dependent oxidoreductase [Sphingomonadaceae bacterium]|nr:SDR family NAD(P)-dependent oxidoreductase [Sphingomonadaceae bacterium]
MAPSSIDLSGQVAIVTGAAGGLGRAYALALAERGAAIVANDLGGDTRGEHGMPSLAEAVAEDIRAKGGKAVANADTVATKAGGEAITQAALDHFGRVDIVINNAGNQRNALFEDLTEEDIESVLAVHLKGAFFVTQPAYRLMKRQGYGRIVFTSSQSGVFGNPYRANYGAAKTGVIGLMRVLVQEAPESIRVNSVMPNASGSRMGTPGEERVDKDFIAAMMARGNAYAERMAPDYTAALVTWLASRDCDVTGQVYSVLRGNYARVFSARCEGWIPAGARRPEPEDVAANLAAVASGGAWHEPQSGIDEGDIVRAALDRSLG